jgi:hypothetical protein
LSGGVAKQLLQTIVIANPINLPITLKRQYLPLEILVVLFCWCQSKKYWTINGSAKVDSKPVRAEVWAGSTIELAAPNRFSTKSD